MTWRTELEHRLRALSRGTKLEARRALWSLARDEGVVEASFRAVLAEVASPRRFLEAVGTDLCLVADHELLRCAWILDGVCAEVPADHVLHDASVGARVQRKIFPRPAFIVKGDQAVATAIPDVRQKYLFASGNDSGPLQTRHRKLLAANPRTIAVGSREKTAHGELRCTIESGWIQVGLFDSRGKLKGRALRYRPGDRALVREGAPIPEAAFGCSVYDIVVTAWNDGDDSGDSLWTVHGLRTRGTLEASE